MRTPCRCEASAGRDVVDREPHALCRALWPKRPSGRLLQRRRRHGGTRSHLLRICSANGCWMRFVGPRRRRAANRRAEMSGSESHSPTTGRWPRPVEIECESGVISSMLRWINSGSSPVPPPHRAGDEDHELARERPGLTSLSPASRCAERRRSTVLASTISPRSIISIASSNANLDDLDVLSLGRGRPPPAREPDRRGCRFPVKNATRLRSPRPGLMNSSPSRVTDSTTNPVSSSASRRIAVSGSSPSSRPGRSFHEHAVPHAR